MPMTRAFHWTIGRCTIFAGTDLRFEVMHDNMHVIIRDGDEGTPIGMVEMAPGDSLQLFASEKELYDDHLGQFELNNPGGNVGRWWRSRPKPASDGAGMEPPAGRGDDDDQ